MIHVFGDSFAADDTISVSWVSGLGKILKTGIINHAVSGSSSEFSILKFMSTCKSITANDIVIFSFATIGRLHFKHINDRLPRAGCAFWNDYKTNQDFVWVKDNEKFIEWYYTNVDYHLLEINTEGYLQILKNFARKNPDITVVVFFNTKHDYWEPCFDKVKNFLMPNISLFEISCREFLDVEDFGPFVQYSKVDPRCNHLSQPNREKLVNLTYDAIISQSIDDFTEDKFLTKILPTLKDQNQYREIIKQGYLLYNEHAYKNLGDS